MVIRVFCECFDFGDERQKFSWMLGFYILKRVRFKVVMLSHERQCLTGSINTPRCYRKLHLAVARSHEVCTRRKTRDRVERHKVISPLG